LAEAKDKAWGGGAGAHLVVKDSGKMRDSELPEGCIVSQDPPESAIAESGDTVFVALSKGIHTPPSPSVAPSPPSPPVPPPPPGARDSVRSAYRAWLDAWQSRSIERYLSYYADDCSIKRTGKSAHGKSTLRSRMAADFAKKSYIRIQSAEPSISVNGTSAKLTAWQEYDSSTWRDKGTKTLRYAWRNGRWLITYESFAMSSGGRK